MLRLDRFSETPFSPTLDDGSPNHHQDQAPVAPAQCNVHGAELMITYLVTSFSALHRN